MYVPNTQNENNVSKKSWKKTRTLWILSFFFNLSLHRFYAGKKATAIIWILTFGCFWIGYIWDGIKIYNGKFTDNEGKLIIYN